MNHRKAGIVCHTNIERLKQILGVRTTILVIFIVKMLSLYRVFKANISMWHTKLIHPKRVAFKDNIL